MEVETVPTLDEIRRRRDRTQEPLETVHADLDGMHSQLDMMRDGVWRNLNNVDELRKEIKALTQAVGRLTTMAAVTEVQLAALAQRVEPQKPDIPTRLLTGVLVACVVLLTLKQVGWL